MVEIIDSLEGAEAISDEWNRLVAVQGAMPESLGPTSNCELALLAKAIHMEEGQLRIYVHRDREEIDEILPCFVLRQRLGPLRYKKLGLITDLYPGRSGVIYRSNGAPRHVLLNEVLTQPRTWDVFEMTFVAGTELERRFLELTDNVKLSAQVISSVSCPFIEFPESWQALTETFTKKFRYNIRSREQKLRSAGPLHVRYSKDVNEIDEFFEAVITIERNSWKEAAGTSLTMNERQQIFHERMAPLCAANGTFHGCTLFLGEQPVAHIIGLYCNRVFYCLKSSFADDFRHLSPGVALKALVMQDLITSGARYWDFVGPAEDHKMQWTNRTYTLNTYAVFAPSITGRLLQARWNSGRLIRQAHVFSR